MKSVPVPELRILPAGDAILKNPAAAIRDCGLSEAEGVALLGGDVKTLYMSLGGVDAFLMAHLASRGVCGLNPGSYREWIRRARLRDN